MTANQAIEWIIADARVHDNRFTHDTTIIAQCIANPVHRVAVCGCLQRIMECRIAGENPAKDLVVQYWDQIFNQLGINGLTRR